MPEASGKAADGQGAGFQLIVRLPEELQGRVRAALQRSGAAAARAVAPRSTARSERRAAGPGGPDREVGRRLNLVPLHAS